MSVVLQSAVPSQTLTGSIYTGGPTFVDTISGVPEVSYNPIPPTGDILVDTVIKNYQIYFAYVDVWHSVLGTANNDDLRQLINTALPYGNKAQTTIYEMTLIDPSGLIYLLKHKMHVTTDTVNYQDINNAHNHAIPIFTSDADAIAYFQALVDSNKTINTSFTLTSNSGIQISNVVVSTSDLVKIQSFLEEPRFKVSTSYAEITSVLATTNNINATFDNVVSFINGGITTPITQNIQNSMIPLGGTNIPPIDNQALKTILSTTKTSNNIKGSLLVIGGIVSIGLGYYLYRRSKKKY